MNKNRQKRASNPFFNFLKKVTLSRDVYGESVGFEVDGSNVHKSVCGAFVSIIITVAVSMYAYSKY